MLISDEHKDAVTPPPRAPRQQRQGVVQRIGAGVVAALDHALSAESLAGRSGLLQSLDPRIKIVVIVSLIGSAVLSATLNTLLVLFGVAIVMALASGIPLARMARQVWLSVLLVTGMIALPAAVLVPGKVITQVPWLGWPITAQGLRSATLLVARAETTASYALLVILTTRWTHLLKALRCLGVPVVLVAMLGMTHRYIFVLLNTAAQMFEARRSRIVGPLRSASQRQLAAASVGVMLGKALDLANDVHLAMISRGYTGEVQLIDQFHTHRRDWLALACALAVPITIIWMER